MVSSQHMRSIRWRISLRSQHPDRELRMLEGSLYSQITDYGYRVVHFGLIIGSLTSNLSVFVDHIVRPVTESLPYFTKETGHIVKMSQ